MMSSELIIVHAIMLASSILIGLLGKFMRPKSPNSLSGYRTRKSQLSQATWDFANEYAGNLIVWSSLVTIVVEIFSVFTMPANTSILVTAGVMTLGIFTCMALTEYQLTKRFDKEGTPKSLSGDRY